MDDSNEEDLLEAVTLRNASSVFLARQRAEQELLRTKEELQQSVANMRVMLAERDRARAEAEEARRIAQEANEAKTRFLRMISHELRTPLGAIDGYAALLGYGVHGALTDAQSEAISRIRHNQKHLLRLVDELLDFARIESGNVTLTLSPLALQGLFVNVQPIIEPQITAKRLHLEVQLDDPSLVVLADRERVEQILLNLLSNAVKFTMEGGFISVNTTATVKDVSIHVLDNGIGIAPEQHEEIFESFYQVRPSLSGLGGTGLGLAISRQLAQSMNGSLTVVSAPGEGSTFTLTLPRVSPALD
jgi:signal transduction histidine kinase